MKSGVLVDEGTAKEILSMISSGVSVRETSRRVKVSRQTIAKIVSVGGVPIDLRRWNGRPRVSTEEAAE